MSRLSAASGPPHYLEQAWPETLEPADPWAGDELLYDHAPHANHRAYGGDLSPDEFDAADRSFFAAYVDVLCGRSPWGTAAALAAPLAIVGDRNHDARHANPVPFEPHQNLLSDFAEDWVPDMGLIAPDRVLGPWADTTLPRGLRGLAAGILSFSPMISPAVRPVGRAIRCKPRPPVDVRAVLKTLLFAPPSLYRRVGDTWESALPLSPGFAPQGPTRGPDAPAAVARALPGPNGWFLATALPLPTLPDPNVLLRRLDLEYLRWRRHERRLTWEDLLRDRSEVLYRTSCEWSWMHTRRDTERCWTTYWA